MSNRQIIRRRVIARAVAACFALDATSSIAALSLAETPVLEAKNIPPNLVVTLDDSGSMRRAFVPDNLCTTSGPGTKRIKSAYYNPLQYDPTRIYKAPVNDVGTPYTTSFTAAYYNGFDPTRGSVNLSTSYQWTLGYNPAGLGTTLTQTNSCGNDMPDGMSVGANPATGTYTPVQAYYYVRDNSLTNCTPTDMQDEDCYRRVNVSSTSGPGGTDERQNFANWYSFYRNRTLSTASSAALAFVTLPEDVRVAWQGLTTCNSFGTNCDGWKNASGYDANLDNRIRGFSGTHKQRFYNWISRLPAVGNTPLRLALSRAGEYYRTSGVDSPYAQNPHETSWGPELACRQNYTIMMTDGYWNDANASPAAGNADNITTNAPDGLAEHKFNAGTKPFSEVTSDTLSDVAFKYWFTDLRTDSIMINNVPTYMVVEADGDATSVLASDFWNAKNDPATWQHMVTFTVGLGMQTALGNLGLTYTKAGGTWGGSYDDLVSGAKTWPAPADNSINNVADLWHAAINSRGQFFSAENPDDLKDAFTAIINRIAVGRGGAAAAAANSNQVAAGSAIYAGVYYGKTNNQLWPGELAKYPLDTATGAPIGTKAWTTGGLGTDASGRTVWIPGTMSAPDPNGRVIITYKPTTRSGVPFRWSSLDPAQQTALSGGLRSGSDVLNWTRGDATQEGEYDAASGLKGLRARPVTKLGDIVNSSPAYVGKPSAGLPGEEYFQFFRDNESRPPIVYVGSNDGMLHGFNDSGAEVLAYVPSMVYGKLREVSQPAYEHRFLVDGSPAVGDIESSGSWQTVLIGGLRAGGKGYYALNITNPATFSEANASSIVKWEFSESNDSSGYLGYSFSQPIIAKLENGKWAAIVGNGYNNTNNTPALYVFYINEGSAGWTLGTNYFRIPVSTTPVDGNGLSQPTAVDTDGDGMVDAVWAGDLAGNVWKFDISSVSPGAWAVGYSGTPLFKARSAGGVAQPITTSPRVVKHPKGGWFVAVGTGRALTAIDTADTSAQSVYGVWDINGPVTSRSVLMPHLAETAVTRSDGKVVRTFSDDRVAPDWWSPTHSSGQFGYYFDLPDSGERVINEMQNRGGALAFVSVVPNGDPCTGGGYSWLNEFDLLTGARLVLPPWDLNGDGAFNATDAMPDGRPETGMKMPLSGASITVTSLDSNRENKLIVTARGEFFSQMERKGDSTGRMSWREIMR